MGDAHVGEGALHSMHFWFAGEAFWMVNSWALASSTGMSAAMAGLLGGTKEGEKEPKGNTYKV